MLTLKIKPPVTSPRKMGLFGNSRELQSSTSKLWQNHWQVQRNSRRGILFYRGKGGVGRLLQTKQNKTKQNKTKQKPLE